jgi:hypothetical protein
MDHKIFNAIFGGTLGSLQQPLKNIALIKGMVVFNKTISFLKLHDTMEEQNNLKFYLA